MSTPLPNCPECSSPYVYEMGPLLVCPECAHEWSPSEKNAAEENAPVEEEPQVRDSVGNVLSDGDSVTIVKSMRVKGSSTALKAGTKVRGIRLVPDRGDGHDIEAKVDGFGDMQLKSIIVKKN